MQPFEIVEYRGGRDPEIAAFILAIQRDDVGVYVAIEDQPELLDLAHAYGQGAFWLAAAGGEIVGTIGMMRFGEIGVLKKLFVRQDHRGRGGVAHALYERALAWTMAQHLTAILLDTPAVATRSHAFYERMGFHRASRTDLPAGYAFPDRDSLIFKQELCGAVASHACPRVDGTT
ncbi:GNAT family N-acetyltransferase [Sphingomonas sp. RHCKR7]|uniref:GNAT family N-acetyltransferase n=1 Tax=Sphingomonas folli TaxID=2862497 RepID=UPI001C6717D6|nr:GNAT family N-acetyltransferase [Sphingomonas folli]MBW6525240.1 GNAT family N-acetyltransferase [Sphingomonas folli]